MKKRLALVFGALALAFFAVAGWQFMAPSDASASPDYTGFHAYIDAGHGTYFGFTLDSMSKPTGTASLGVKGVGMVDFGAPKYVIHNGHSIDITFDGSATLETDAVVDLNLGLNQPGQNIKTVSARLQGDIDPEADRAQVELWLNGKHYTMEGDRPDASPDQALDRMVDAVAHQNWGSLYDMGSPTLQQMATRTAFVNGMASGWQSHIGSGKATVRLTSTPKLVDSAFGYWAAQAGLKITSGQTSFTFTVILQYVGNRWLLLDLEAS